MKKQKTKKQSTNKGITLIALIITIIVMLILVAVTITMAINGGLFEYADKAVSDTKNMINEEQWLAGGGITIDGVYYSSMDEYIEQVTENNDSRIKLSYTVTPAEDKLSAVITVNARMLGGLLKDFKEYREWALERLEGKTEEQIEQIFVDGQNYWNEVEDWGEPTYANIDEIVKYWSENYCDGRFDDVEGMVADYGYDSLADFAIDWQYVYPNEYEYFADYWVWAKGQIKGKTDEEIEQIFVDGQNFMNEAQGLGMPYFEDIHDLEEFILGNFSENYPNCEDIYDIAEADGYNSLSDMAIDMNCVYPEKFTKLLDDLDSYYADMNLAIADPDNEIYYGNTVEYIVTENGEYTFHAINQTGTESNSITVKVKSIVRL